MSIEIERKFLVNKTLWGKEKPAKSILIRQGYLVSMPDLVIRARKMANKGYITIKGANSGISRSEFEYEIPLKDADEIMDKFAENAIEKIRHEITFENKIWIVDEFKGLNEGLLIAEIELTDVNENFIYPVWLSEEVSSDYKYANSNLAINPYTKWKTDN